MIEPGAGTSPAAVPGVPDVLGDKIFFVVVTDLRNGLFCRERTDSLVVFVST